MLLKMIFSTPIVNSVVGKNGSNLQRFLSEFNCHVYAPKIAGHHSSNADGLLYVEGEVDSVLRCIEEILSLASPYPLNKKTSTDPSYISFEL